jgi:hypothetical protein
MIREFLARLRFSVFRKKRSALDHELRFHLAQSIAVNEAAGLPPGEARRQALVEVGDIERTKEQCEQHLPGSSIVSVVQDLSYGLRALLRNPGFTAVAVLSLALGIGATTAMFSLIYAVLLHPFPYADADRIMNLLIK